MYRMWVQKCPPHVRKAKHSACLINQRVEFDNNEDDSEKEYDGEIDGFSQLPSSTSLSGSLSQSTVEPTKTTADVHGKINSAPKVGCVPTTDAPLRTKRKKPDSDNELVLVMRAKMEARREEARSRFEEMMAMAELQRQRDDRRLEEMRLQAQLQREREEIRLEEIRLQAKADRDLILTLFLANRVDRPVPETQPQERTI